MTCAPADLLRLAHGAASKAHCPYSGFHVGAVLCAPGGQTWSGCNVENASYGLTICAERAAFAAAITAGARAFEAIAIAADGPEPAPPCGACRQVMAEFCGPEFRIYSAPRNDLSKVRAWSLRELLPSPFTI
jgi:cytidine deaminase